MITKKSLKTERKNDFYHVLYDGEIIFQTQKKPDIDYDKILESINKLGKNKSKMSAKEKKCLIILGLGNENMSYKQRYFLDRLIIEDKECMEAIRKLNKNLADEVQSLSIANEVNYQQYNFKRIWKKWLIFLALATIFYFLELSYVFTIILFLFFFFTEPKLFIEIAKIHGKLKQNS